MVKIVLLSRIRFIILDFNGSLFFTFLAIRVDAVSMKPDNTKRHSAVEVSAGFHLCNSGRVS